MRHLASLLCSIYGAHYEYLRRTQVHESFYEIFFQFMKERKRKEEALRSAVTGKKIKLKVKKSSKDKEVNKDWVQKWEILLLISISIMICNVKLKKIFLGGGV